MSSGTKREHLAHRKIRDHVADDYQCYSRAAASYNDFAKTQASDAPSGSGRRTLWRLWLSPRRCVWVIVHRVSSFLFMRNHGWRPCRQQCFFSNGRKGVPLHCRWRITRREGNDLKKLGRPDATHGEAWPSSESQAETRNPYSPGHIRFEFRREYDLRPARQPIKTGSGTRRFSRFHTWLKAAWSD